MSTDRKATAVHLTTTLPFPITILSLLVSVGAEVQRGTNILYYNFDAKPVDEDGKEETHTSVGSYESPVDGAIISWEVKVGDVVKDAKQPVVSILEPCRHEEQMNGLCLICMKDVTFMDYTGFSDAARATVSMVHDAAGITVSQAVAERLEAEDFTRLLKSRRLSLVVDLDQTIVHATVDPTVAEWIAEGEAWEAGKEGAKQNPNWEALKDVKRFKLADERKVSRSAHPKMRHRRDDGTWYYIKLRPGLHEFLEELSKLYEMHVYTMGTRAYASEVVKVIDPTGAFFGNRVLSRDESGSATFKNLTRLFPCNSSMAVIIDDRADVWDTAKANLVKVVPYDFFVGIGDINAAFLPKLRGPDLPHNMGVVRRSPLASDAPSPSSSSSNGTAVDSPSTPDLVPKVVLADDEEPDDTETKAALELEQEITLEAQQKNRPLMKKMAELEAHVREEEGAEKEDTESADGKEEHHPVERALLTNNDHELMRVRKVLAEVHRRYFKVHDTSKSRPNVMEIIPDMKAEVFDGVHLVFSSLIPQDMPPMETEIWRQALLFGAGCHVKMDKEVTHVVAAKRGTDKVNIALSRPNVKIVNPMWFMDSIAMWHRQKEEDYPLEGLEERRPEEEVIVTHPTTPQTAQRELTEPLPPRDGDEEDDEEDYDDGDLDLGDVDWGAADAELEEMLGDDDGSEMNSTDGYDDQPSSSSKSRGKKRSRTEASSANPSPTPSESGSPKAKRKRLDQGTSSPYLTVPRTDSMADGSEGPRTTDGSVEDVMSEYDSDDDFLARALNEDS